jgi:hypothetical protein
MVPSVSPDANNLASGLKATVELLADLKARSLPMRKSVVIG